MRQRLLRKMLARYYAYQLLSGMHFFAGVLVPFFTDWGGLNLTQVQLLQSWFMLWIFLFEVPTGVIADRFGRKTSLVVAGGAITLATQIYGHAAHLGLFLIGEMLFAFGYACISGARDALVYDFLRAVKATHQQPVIKARGQAWHLVGITIAAPVGSWLAAHWGLNTPMLLTGIPAMLAIVVVWSLPETRTWQRQQSSSVAILRNAWRFARIEPRFRRASLDFALVYLAGYFVIWLYQPLLLAAGVPVAQFGWYHTLLTLAQVGLYRLYPWLFARLGTRERYLHAATVLTIVGYAVAIGWQTPMAILVFLTLAGGFGLSRHHLGEAYLQDVLPSGERATLLSGVSMFNRLLLVIANPVIGYLADHSLTTALIAVAMFPLLALCLTAIFHPTPENPV